MTKKNLNLDKIIYNNIMKNGKKSICEKKVFKTIKLLQKNYKKNHKEIIKLAIINSMPVIEMRQIKKKKQKNIKEFPYVLKKKNRISLGIKSIVKKTNISLIQKLFQEFILLPKKKSEIFKTKEIEYKLALTKKKYSFFRWFY